MGPLYSIQATVSMNGLSTQVPHGKNKIMKIKSIFEWSMRQSQEWKGSIAADMRFVLER